MGLIKFEKHGAPIQDRLGLSLLLICNTISCHSIELMPHICLSLKDIKVLKGYVICVIRRF